MLQLSGVVRPIRKSGWEHTEEVVSEHLGISNRITVHERLPDLGLQLDEMIKVDVRHEPSVS